MPLMHKQKDKAVALALFAALMWGVWWAPIRVLGGMGINGPWASVLMGFGAILLFSVLSVLRRQLPRANRSAIIGAAFVGLAVTTYSTAVVYGEVVRVVLLFYLAPLWSKLIEWLFMGQRWRWTSTLALTLSFAGVFAMMGSRVGASYVQLGDVLALLSGVAWAIGAAFVFRDADADPAGLALIAGISTIVVGSTYATLAGVSFASAFAPLQTATGIGVGAIYVAPLLFLTLWSAQILPPATITFLLTAEIISGVVSSAVFLDEPFTAGHTIGTILIIAGAVCEVFLTPAQADKESLG